MIVSQMIQYVGDNIYRLPTLDKMANRRSGGEKLPVLHNSLFRISATNLVKHRFPPKRIQILEIRNDKYEYIYTHIY
jgi:hypothetical protein